MKVIIGNIFDSKAQTMVNTVNCVGVMGKGIALEFKKKYPEMFNDYVYRCGMGDVKPGHPYYYRDASGVSIINFPTKDHWRSPSKLSYIMEGLDWFRSNYKKYKIDSVAFPPLGCGNGGLPWTAVGPLMYDRLHDLPIEIEVYAPFGTDPKYIQPAYLSGHSFHSPTELIGKKQLPLNKNWLLLMYTVQRLNHDKYSLNVGRTIFQKVCYVLTYAGVPLGFKFSEGTYGPYSAEVKTAVMTLSNANYMTEKQAGNMIEIVVNPSFRLDKTQFTEDEMARTERAIDLLSRIKNTEHAEMVATVLFAYEELISDSCSVRDIEVFDHVMQWKTRWKGSKEEDVADTIVGLSGLGWMHLVYTGLLPYDDDVYY